MTRMRGWLAVLLPLTYPWDRSGSGTLGPGGPQFSYGVDYCQWLQDLPHDSENPYDDFGGEA